MRHSPIFRGQRRRVSEGAACSGRAASCAGRRDEEDAPDVLLGRCGVQMRDAHHGTVDDLLDGGAQSQQKHASRLHVSIRPCLPLLPPSRASAALWCGRCWNLWLGSAPGCSNCLMASGSQRSASRKQLASECENIAMYLAASAKQQAVGNTAARRRALCYVHLRKSVVRRHLAWRAFVSYHPSSMVGKVMTAQGDPSCSA